MKCALNSPGTLKLKRTELRVKFIWLSYSIHDEATPSFNQRSVASLLLKSLSNCAQRHRGCHNINISFKVQNVGAVMTEADYSEANMNIGKEINIFLSAQRAGSTCSVQT